jgi:hypothetical protein
MLYPKKFSNSPGIILVGEQNLTRYIIQKAIFYRAEGDTACIVNPSGGNRFSTQQGDCD